MDPPPPPLTSSPPKKKGPRARYSDQIRRTSSALCVQTEPILTVLLASRLRTWTNAVRISLSTLWLAPGAQLRITAFKTGLWGGHKKSSLFTLGGKELTAVTKREKALHNVMPIVWEYFVSSPLSSTDCVSSNCF